MSKVVDERIVKMEFDNQMFEKNVQTSMSTIDKLKQKLIFSDSSKGFDNLSTAAKNVDMSTLSNSVDTIKIKFSALQTVATTALVNITNSAMNAGKKLLSAITVDPIKDGFAEYETQMNAVQTILANTQKEGTDVKMVNAALDELNHYADKTIYNFTEMTRNIGTFTAAGVKLDDSVSAIQGIANLAAVSGSTSQQASTAMYQLSQALATGTVKLMDWNSVVNAGMGGQVFQDALTRTSEHLKTGAKAAIAAKGSFRESLQTGWLTTEVLTQTLDQFATAADTQEEYEAAVKKFVDQGYTAEEAKQMADMARTAGNAATKVKTFSQLLSTVKEALGSGWTESWRIVIGDFEEAKELWTGVSDVLNNYINKSADARNAMLKEWADLGGRTALIDTFRNAFNGLLSIVTPIKEAFNYIFPPITAQQLLKITECIRDLTAKLWISDETAAKLEKTFEGLFSIIAIGTDVLGSLIKGIAHALLNFNGFHIGILDGTAAIGEWLVNLRSSIKEADIFNKAITKISDGIHGAISAITNFGKSLKKNVGKNKDLVSFGDNFSTMIIQMISRIGDGFEAVRKSVDQLLGGRSILDILNSMIFTGGLASFTMFQHKITGGLSKIVESISKIFNKAAKGKTVTLLQQVKNCFKAYQTDLNAKALLKIASAIAILSGSIFVLSSIDGQALARSLGGMGVMLGELLAAMAIFDKTTSNVKGAFKAQTTMLAMATAISIMAGALKKMSGIDTVSLLQGLTAISVLLYEMQTFLTTDKFGDNVFKAASSMIIIGAALNIMCSAVKKLGSLDWQSIAKGLSAIAGLLGLSVAFTRLSSKSKEVIKTAGSLILIGQALKSMSGAMSELSSLSWNGIAKGLVGIAGSLAAIVAAIKLIPGDTFWVAMDLPVIASALIGISSALAKFGGMKWNDIAKGLTAVTGSLLALSLSIQMMSGCISGAVALSVACTSLFSLFGVLALMSKLSWEGITKGLVSLAGAFTVIGVASAVLSPLLPVVIGLGAAFTLLGIGMSGIGAGLILIGTGLASVAVGFSSIAAAGVAGATSFVASLSIIILGIIQLFPAIGEKIAEGLVSFVKTLSNSAQEIALAIMTMITGVLDTLATYSPQIVDSLFNFVIGILQSLREHVPDFVEVAIGLIGDFFSAIAKALGQYNASSIAKALSSVGLIVALMYALSGISALIPSATAGVVSIGIILAELTGVLAAFGAISKIPGLSWLIEDGGDFLQEIGTAIGKFIGGIAGGALTGVTSQLPEVGSYLSSFMESIQPFLDGASKINKGIFDGVNELVKVILALTAADLIESIVSWFTGGSSLAKFGEELVPFGEAMRDYGESVSGLDVAAINTSVDAAKSLTDLASTIQNSGGLLSLFVGDNDLGTFGKQLVKFGEGMQAYSESVSDIKILPIRNSIVAARGLIELSNNIKNNSGGLISLFTGDNTLATIGKQLVPFGKGMKSYSDSVAGIKPVQVMTSVIAAKQLIQLGDSIKNNSGGFISLFTGDNSLAQIGKSLVPFGEGMKSYSDSVAGLKILPVMNSIIAARCLVELSDSIKNNSGGLISVFTGDNDLTKFGTQISLFGNGLFAYGNSVSQLNVDAINSSIPAAKGLVEVANSIQNNIGGLTSLFTGDNDLKTFGSTLCTFGLGLKDYANSVTDLNVDAISNSIPAAKALAELTNVIPQNGGLLSIFTGNNDLSYFGSQLSSFGFAMNSYADSVSGFDESSLTSMDAVAEAASKLAGMSSSLPQLGGLFGLFTGEQSLSTFGYQLSSFGGSIKAYADSVSGIGEDSATSIDMSVNAASKLAGLYNYIPQLGGLTSIFSGDQNLIVFGNQLVPFGKALKEYGDAVTDVKTDAIDAATSAIVSLCGIYNNLPALGGMASLFSGDQNLATIGTQLAPFGDGLYAYYESVEYVKPEPIVNSANAVKSLVDIYNSLSNSGGFVSLFSGDQDLSNFGSQLETFGDSLVTYSNSVVDVKPEAVSNSATAAKELVSVIESINGISTSNVGSFVTAINTLGTAQVENFVSAFSDGAAASRLQTAGANLISSLEKGIKSKSESIKSSMTSVLNTLINDVKGKTDKFKSPGEKIVVKMTSGIKGKKGEISKALISAIKSALKDVKSYYTDFYSAGSHLVSGFAKGISANTYKATAKARAMAKAATKAAKEQLDIHSPSKVFERLGKFVPAGLAVGIEKMSHVSSDSAKNMAQSAVETARTALSRMTDVLSSDMSNAPTITPVLDLSNVQSGMGTLGTMLNSANSIGLTANLNAISSMRAARRQNGNNGDVVSAIKSLGKDINNMDRNSYNIGGITYEQGSDVAEAIETLVRASIIGGRS